MIASSPLLSLRQLACERADRVLFKKLDADIRAGDLVQVMGPNGSGKTTLLRILAGLSNDYQGSLLWREQSVIGQEWDFRSQLLYLGHLTAIKKNLIPLENLAWYAAAGGFPLSVTQAEQALNQVNLKGFERSLCYQLSAGQQRRVALARLVLAPRALWILDEPFTALDKEGVSILEALISQQLAGGGAVIMTSHQDLQSLSAKTIDLRDYAVPADERLMKPFKYAAQGVLGD